LGDEPSQPTDVDDKHTVLMVNTCKVMLKNLLNVSLPITLVLTAAVKRGDSKTEALVGVQAERII